MPQDTLLVPNSTGSVFRTAVQNALKSVAGMFSGTALPSETYAHQLHADESNDFILIRDKANTAWRRAGFINAPMLGHVGAQVQAKTSAYTLVKADAGSLFACTGSFTLTLPAVASVGNPYTFGVANGGTGLITIDPNGAELIDGATTLLIGPGDGVYVIGDGATWITFAQRSGRVLLDRQVPSAVAQVDIKNIFTTRYDAYELVLTDFVPATDNVELWLRVSEDNGASFISGATDYKWALNTLTDAGTRSDGGSTGAAQMKLVGGAGNGTGESLSAVIVLPNMNGAKHKHATWSAAMHTQAPAGADVRGTGIYKATTNAINAVRVMFSAGNITSGTVATYGLRK